MVTSFCFKTAPHGIVWWFHKYCYQHHWNCNHIFSTKLLEMIKMKIRRWLLEAVIGSWTGVNLLILIICLLSPPDVVMMIKTIMVMTTMIKTMTRIKMTTRIQIMTRIKRMTRMASVRRNAGSPGRCGHWLPLNIVMRHERPFALKSNCLEYYITDCVL